MGTGLEIALIAAAVVGTATSAYSAIQQGQQASRAADYQAQIAANNAEINRRNASLARTNSEMQTRNAALAEDAARKQEANQIRRTRSLIGSQIAAQASNGLIVNEGSALDLQEDSATLGAMSQLEIRDNGARQAAGYRMSAYSQDIAATNALAGADEAQLRGSMYRESGDNAASAGWLNAGATVLSGASRAYGQWDARQTAGMGSRGSAFNDMRIG